MAEPEELTPGDRADFLREWALDGEEWSDERILMAMGLGML